MQVLVPSRGRPERAAECFEWFETTKRLPFTTMQFVVDEDDESDYEGKKLPIRRVPNLGGMGAALNYALGFCVDDIVGFIGDDHRFRTAGWDERITDENAHMGGGILYGNDLMQSENLPTQVFMDRRITDALGWMALPGATHLYLDDTWKTLGNWSHRLKYLPDVIIEHMHYLSGKSEVDEGYLRVNSTDMYNHDREVYSKWLETEADEDVEKVKRALW